MVQRKLLAHIEKQFAEKNADYGRKLYLIEKCIYGVDIQQIAVEIAKLRFFISLLVDEKIDFDKPKANYGIEPLPNLDFKLMQGNSLISTFAGIDFNEIKQEAETISLDLSDPTKEYIKIFEDLKNEYLNVSDKEEKDKLLVKIEKTMLNIFEEKINEHIPQLKIIDEKYATLPNKQQREKAIWEEKQKLTKKLGFDIEEKEKELIAYTEGRKPKDFFLWNLYFAEVFNQKGGFDIVIANPPYLKERGNAKVFKTVNESDFGKKYHQGKMDFWYYFLHKSIDIKSQNGCISFITSRYWIASSGAKKIINRVGQELRFINVLDIGKVKVFNNVIGQHMVSIYESKNNNNVTVYKKVKDSINDIFSMIDTEHISVNKINSDKIIQNSEIKFEFSGIDITKNEVIPLGKLVDCSQGVVEATDKISRKVLENNPVSNVSVGDGVFVLTKPELIKNKIPIDGIIKPYLDPNSVGRYYTNHNDEFLIYSDKIIKSEIKGGKYGNIKTHLDKYKPFITSSNKPNGIHRARKQKYFDNPKLICKGMFSKPDFTFDDEKYYVGFSFTVMIEKDPNFLLKYILAILNSKIAHYWFIYNGKRRGVGFDIGVQKFRQFPIVKTDLSNQQKLELIVDQILTAKKANPQADTTELEREIDQLVYELYDLTEEEIAIVENNSKA